MLLGILVSVTVIASIWFIYIVFTSKDGYEDETGFHYGKEPVDKSE